MFNFMLKDWLGIQQKIMRFLYDTLGKLNEGLYKFDKEKNWKGKIIELAEK